MKTIALILIISASALLGGCVTTNTQTSAAKLAVQIATVKVLDNNPDYVGRTLAIAGEVRRIAGAEKFDTVDLLIAYVRSRIDWDRMTAADVLLINELLRMVGEELKARVGPGRLTSEKILVVADVALWIEQAAAAMK